MPDESSQLVRMRKSPRGKGVNIRVLFIIKDDRRGQTQAKAFLKEEQAADAAVAIGERMDPLKSRMEFGKS